MNKGVFLKNFIATRWFHKFKSRQGLEAYQQRELAKYQQFLESHSPYFRQGIPADFKTMNKAFMMENFNQLNTLGVDRDQALNLALESERTRDFSVLQGQVAVGLSSGTSGHRGLFITSEKERSMWAAAILAKMLPKGHLLGHKIAFFLRADNELYQTINSFFIQLKYFDIFQDMEAHIEELNRYQPSIIVAPASILLDLSRRILSRELQLKPQKLVAVAEILEEADGKKIAQAFGLDHVDQVYQATEGFLATSCAYGQLHLNEDIIFVDKHYLDQHRFYPIITDFKRTSQPIFRYELNDILVENKEPCPCGSLFTRIDKIEGRSDDIFYFQGLDQQPVPIFPDFIRRCLLFVEGITDYQVRQHSESHLEVCLAPRNPAYEAAIEEQFALLAQEKAFVKPRLTFSDYVRNRKVKLKRVERIK
ncbi:F390 synthetase-related protein [Streptococcus oricebi]|uniref:CoF synthetase n=1 Tax=Streptococcus oricebi TaxID=1547447 RepID=A0ABS5B5X9_9STRE|nr:F390 synthetase-related protein [Streptococcus oricebi]MBP2624155.1 CoF synthetase [Streptococcus oricebi]